MNILGCPDQASFRAADTAFLRERFLLADLFQADSVNAVYWTEDRGVIGGAVPVNETLGLEADSNLAAEFFCQRREIGIVNLGNKGLVFADGDEYALENQDFLYLGRGTREITFMSEDRENPACFYFVSFPAHQTYPARHVSFSQAECLILGNKEQANERWLYKMIHPGELPTCQLVMGFTVMQPGSIWNTMPPHTHNRRCEAYCYYNVPEDQVVVHLLGKPDETRHLMVKNREVALSPSWSIHAGAGTAAYSFVWAMGGENQEFTDMDGVSLPDLQ